MADQTSGSLYPPPPAFYKLYSPNKDSDTFPPPPLPVKGQYTIYGTVEDTADALPPLQGQKLFRNQLDSVQEIKAELRRLHDDLNVAIEQLIDVLAKAPSQYARAVESVIASLNNVVYVANMLRPAQARATLKHMLELDVQQKRKALQQLHSYTDRTEQEVHGSLDALLKPRAASAEDVMSQELQA